MELKLLGPLKGAMLLFVGLIVLHFPAAAQTPVQLTAADCIAEKDAMRRAGFTQAEVERNLKPLGLQNGLNVPLAQDMIVKLKYFQNIAMKGRDYRNLAIYNVALCALNTALSRNVASQSTAPSSTSSYAAPPRAIESSTTQRTPVRGGNDTACVRLQSNRLWNGCNFTVDVHFCVTNPQQTKNVFDNSDAFKCPNGGLIALGSGSFAASTLNGAVHWFACDAKKRGSGGRTNWNPQTGEYEGWCEEVRQ